MAANPIIPPSDKEIEESVIGIALANDIIPDLEPRHFYDTEMLHVFMAIQAAGLEGRRVDAMAAYGYLKSADPASTLVRMIELQELSPYKDNLPYYESRLREYAARRDALAFSIEIERRVQSSEPGLVEWIQTRAAQIGGAREVVATDMATIVKIYSEELLAASKNPGQTVGIRSGLPSLDRMTGGAKPGQLWVICARPSVGKSALAHNFARKAAEDKAGTLIVSAEQTRREVFLRMLADVTAIGSDAWEAWQPPVSEDRLAKAGERLGVLPIHVVDCNVRLDADILREARRYRPRILIVDYIQLFDAAAKRRDLNRATEIGMITKAMKAWAKDTGGTCVLLAQLNRQIEGRTGADKMPRLSDLRDSGEIEQDADVVVGLARDYMAKGIPDGVGQKAQMGILKNRNGKCGLIDALYFAQRCAWAESAGVEEQRGMFEQA